MYLAKYGVIHSIKISTHIHMWPLTKLYVSCFQVSYLSENKSRMSNFICLYDYSDENLYIMMCSRSCPDPPKPLPMDLSVVELLPKERFHDLIEATLVDNRGYSEGTEKQQQQRIVEMNWSTGIRTITSPTKACEKKNPMPMSVCRSRRVSNVPKG